MSKKFKCNGDLAVRRKERLGKLILGKIEDLLGKKLKKSEISHIKPDISSIISSGGSESDIKKIVRKIKVKRKRELSRRKSKNSKEKKQIVEKKDFTEKKVKRERTGDYWNALTEIDVQKFEDECRQKKIEKKKNKMNQMKLLNEQVRRKEAVKKREKEDEYKWAEYAIKDHDEWLKEEEKVRVEKRRRILEEKLFRAKQLREREARLRKIEEQRRREDLHILEEAKKKIEENSLKEKQKKMDLKQKMKEQKKFNEQERLNREEERKRLFEEEIHLQKLYIKKLEKDELARENAFKKIYSKQRNIHKKIAMKTFRSLEEKAAEDEKRARRELDEINKKKEERERMRKLKLKQSIEDQKKWLGEQILHKKKLIEIERDSRRKERERLNAEYEKTKVMEGEKFRKTRRKNMEHSKFIKKQMKDKKKVSTVFGMTENEKRLNVSLLNDVFKTSIE